MGANGDQTSADHVATGWHAPAGGRSSTAIRWISRCLSSDCVGADEPGISTVLSSRCGEKTYHRGMTWLTKVDDLVSL